MKLFAVALPKFPERYAHAQRQIAQFPKLNGEIIGVDGSKLDLSLCCASSNQSRALTLGQVGCAMSHLEVYRRILKMDLPNAFVIEDDAILPDNLEAILSDCMPYLGPRTVISFYSPRPKPTKFSCRAAPVIRSGKLFSPTSRLNVHTATAYLIGRDAAASIVENNFPVRHLADHWFSFHNEGSVERVLLHYPMPVSIAHFESSIGYDTNLRSRIKSVGSNLPLFRRALLHKRRVTERRHKANIIVGDFSTFYDHD